MEEPASSLMMEYDLWRVRGQANRKSLKRIKLRTRISANFGRKRKFWSLLMDSEKSSRELAIRILYTLKN